MTEPTRKPILQKPPGYRDPNAPVSLAPKPPIRKPPIPRSFHPKPKRKSCCRYCCCFFCILIILFIFLIALAGSLFYLWFEPKFPNFHIQSIKFSRFNVAVKLDGTFLTSQTIVRVQARNPNEKITFYYDRIHVRMTAVDDVDLGSGSIPAFNQGKKNTTVLKFGTQVKNMLIDDDVGTKLKARFRSKEIVISVEVRTKFQLGLQWWRLGKVPVRIFCEGVSLKKLDGGSPPKCTINLLKWINIH